MDATEQKGCTQGETRLTPLKRMSNAWGFDGCFANNFFGSFANASLTCWMIEDYFHFEKYLNKTSNKKKKIN